MTNTPEEKSTPELLPCPFCGSKSVVWSSHFGRVRCNGCYIGTTTVDTSAWPVDRVTALKARSIAEWNTRAAIDSRVSEQEKEINAAWSMIQNCFEIEPRAYFEKEAPKNGFESPLVMAVHYTWKREAKQSASHLLSEVERLRAALGPFAFCEHVGSLNKQDCKVLQKTAWADIPELKDHLCVGCRARAALNPISEAQENQS